eukprot:TRINITY_DN10449_c0_g1_i2.p1 TRINITY_DN10449_c0_g1~~TRINITY_DN10449_c0_g1_i2.p1  ORF type:complete len:159 (-),score=45.56 TRINITY_DN10449_c0_g1_i2:203-679(-)
MLGLPPYQDGSVIVIPSTSSALAEWELDNLMRHHLAHHQASVYDTLTSFFSLLQAVPHMPISHHISQLVTQASHHFKQSLELTKQSDVVAGLQLIAVAVSQANSAFFHPTMLPLLYFPDKYVLAVFCSFFVPVLVPLFSALAKHLKGKKLLRKQSSVN